MKKLLFSIMTVAALASCSSNEENAPVQEYGTISFALTGTSGTPSISVGTRAETTLDYAAAKSYYLTISNSSLKDFTETRKLYSEWSSDQDGTISLPIATGYSVVAESCSEADANEVTNYWGKLRLASEATQFNILNSTNDAVAVKCTVANSRLTFSFDKEVANVFSSYNVVVTSTKKGDNQLKFEEDATATSPIAYFTAGDEVNFVINAVRTSDNKEFSFKGTSFQTEAKKWYKKTIKVAAATDGTIKLEITTDTTMDVESTDVTINPYDGSTDAAETEATTSTEEVTAE